MAHKGATIKKKRRAMETMIAPICPKGPVQHLTVIETITKIPFRPKLMNQAEMA